MPLHSERHDRVALLTLDDPERRNALTLDLVRAIVDTFDALEADDDVGAVVLTGAPPAFCSGADTTALRPRADAPPRDDDLFPSIYEGFLRVLHSSLPTVAAVNGPAVGAGFNLALACDVRLASPAARFDSKFLAIGIHPGGGHTWLLERAVGPQAAAACVLFGERLDGARAAEIGLAWACVPEDELVAHAIAFAARAASAPTPLVGAAKASLREAPWRADFDSAVAAELERQRWSATQPFFGAPGRRPPPAS